VVAAVEIRCSKALAAAGSAAELLGQLALLAGSLVLVHDTVRSGLVDAGDRGANEFFGVVRSLGNGSIGSSGTCVNLASHLAVGEVSLHGLTIALDLRLDVGHDYLPENNGADR